MNKVLMALLAFLLAGAVAMPVRAQEEPEVTAGEMDKFLISIGTVVGVSEEAITVSEYDYETDADVNTTYRTTEQTVYEDLPSRDALDIGDVVQVLYIEENGVKTARVVIETEDMDEAEEMGEADDMDEEAPMMDEEAQSMPDMPDEQPQPQAEEMEY